MNSCQSAQSVLFLLDAKLEQVVEIAESPGDKAEARDAEQGVQDLRIDLDPYPAG